MDEKLENGFFENRYGDGSLRARGYRIDGKLHGEVQTWWTDDIPVSRGVYVNGKRTGLHVFWEQDRIARIINYKNGVMHGVYIDLSIEGNRTVTPYTNGKKNGTSKSSGRGILTHTVWEDGCFVMSTTWNAARRTMYRRYSRGGDEFVESQANNVCCSRLQIIKISGCIDNREIARYVRHGSEQTEDGIKIYYVFGKSISEDDYKDRLKSTGAHVAKTTPLLPQLGYLVSSYAEVIGTLQELNTVLTSTLDNGLNYAP